MVCADLDVVQRGSVDGLSFADAHGLAFFGERLALLDGCVLYQMDAIANQLSSGGLSPVGEVVARRLLFSVDASDVSVLDAAAPLAATADRRLARRLRESAVEFFEMLRQVVSVLSPPAELLCRLDLFAGEFADAAGSAGASAAVADELHDMLTAELPSSTLVNRMEAELVGGPCRPAVLLRDELRCRLRSAQQSEMLPLAWFDRVWAQASARHDELLSGPCGLWVLTHEGTPDRGDGARLGRWLSSQMSPGRPFARFWPACERPATVWLVSAPQRLADAFSDVVAADLEPVTAAVDPVAFVELLDALRPSFGSTPDWWQAAVALASPTVELSS